MISSSHGGAVGESRDRGSNPSPPTGDTGVISPAWGVDWLALTVWGLELDRVASIVSEAFHLGRPVGLPGWTAMGGARFYGRRHEYLGATLLSEPQAQGVEDNVHVVMPGEACAVGVDALLQLVVRLNAWSGRCQVVRLDLAVDGVPFVPGDAYEAVKAGQVVSWARRGRDGMVGHAWHASNGQGEGDTLYIGRRSSQRWLRIYSKRGPTRVELETKGAYAHAVATNLIDRRGDEREQARFVVACLREFCDFGEPKDAVHGARRLTLLPWWAAFVESVDRLGKIVLDRRQELSVDRSLKWVDRSVVPTLAMIVAAYGFDGERLLDAWINSAIPYLTPKHQAAIREFEYAYRRGRYAVPRSSHLHRDGLRG